MKKIYVLEFDMFDGEDNTHNVDVFSNLQKAKECMDDYLEQYEPFWEDFNVINKGETDFSAYDSGCYDSAHLDIIITEREIIE